MTASLEQRSCTPCHSFYEDMFVCSGGSYASFTISFSMEYLYWWSFYNLHLNGCIPLYDRINSRHQFIHLTSDVFTMLFVILALSIKYNFCILLINQLGPAQDIWLLKTRTIIKIMIDYIKINFTNCKVVTQKKNSRFEVTSVER